MPSRTRDSPIAQFSCSSAVPRQGDEKHSGDAGSIVVRVVDQTTSHRGKSDHFISFAAQERCTLFVALYKHGGLTELADTEHIRIIRKTATAEPTCMEIDAKKLLYGGNPHDDVSLLPDDTIIIPLRARQMAPASK